MIIACVSELNDIKKLLNHFWIRTGVCSNFVVVTHNATINLTCRVTSGVRGSGPPNWYANGTWVTTTGDRYRVTTSNGVYYTSALTINGNLTFETVNIYCKFHNTTEERFVHMHNTTLRFQGWLHSFFCYLAQAFASMHCKPTTSKTLTFTGRLPSPESVDIKENSSTIEWKLPYSAMNNESDIIHVDPHITHYTVYITDNYTGNIVVKENVTETHYTPNIQGDGLCPMYQVSAWNVGGEGNKSDLVWDSTPRGKQAKDFLN